MSDSESLKGIRATDSPPVKVTREIPLPWLLSIVGSVLIFAATVYFTQQKQSEQISELKTQVVSLSAQFSARVLVDQDKDFTQAAKIQEHDFKISDLQRRVNAVEREGVKR